MKRSRYIAVMSERPGAANQSRERKGRRGLWVGGWGRRKGRGGRSCTQLRPGRRIAYFPPRAFASSPIISLVVSSPNSLLYLASTGCSLVRSLACSAAGSLLHDLALVGRKAVPGLLGDEQHPRAVHVARQHQVLLHLIELAGQDGGRRALLAVDGPLFHGRV